MNIILNRRIVISGLVVYGVLICNYFYGKHLIKNNTEHPQKTIVSISSSNKVVQKKKKQNKRPLIKKESIKKQPKTEKTSNKNSILSHKKNTVKIISTFYGEGDDENGKGRGKANAYGKRLRYGCIALPRNMKLGTKIYIKELGMTFTGMDRGNPRFIRKVSENTIRIDMFIPRKKGESLHKYKKRISNMGIKKYTGVIK